MAYLLLKRRKVMAIRDVKLGENIRIIDENMINLYECEIGDDSLVGPFVEITEGVKIGKRCKVESHTFICSGVTIEDDVFLGHGVTFTNDLYPKVDRKVKYIGTLVKKGCGIGSNATIVCGITLGEYSVIGAGAVVTKDVPDFAIVAGNPAKVLHQFSSKEEMIEYMASRQSLQE